MVGTFPLRIGSAAQFAQVRSALRSARFDERTICETLRIKAMSDVLSVDLDDVDFASVPDPLPVLVRLFVTCGPMPRAEVERVLDRATLDAMVALGLLDAGAPGPDACHARVLLYPVAGFWIASDRHNHPDGSPFVARPDIVFPAIYGGTLRFLELLPRSHAESALDLGAGSGIGAFVLSRTSARAVASDITERATHFARFNRALNEAANVDVVCGDLYGAVAGQTFDRIVAHPPYVPSVDMAAIWRDGGTTGELLVRRIIEGLPDHLRPGGLACTVSIGLDTAKGRFEDRARGWLGDHHQDFDIVFAAADERSPDEVLRKLAEQDPQWTPAKRDQLKDAFTEAEVVAMPHGALVVRRHAAAEPRPGWTLRAKLSEATDGDDLERAFFLHDRLSEPRFRDRVADCRPVLAPRLQVNVAYRVDEGALVPADYVFETDKPFAAKGRVDGWLVPLLAGLDGKRTVAEIIAKAKAEGELPDGFSLADFCALVARMGERGFLLLPDDG